MWKIIIFFFYLHIFTLSLPTKYKCGEKLKLEPCYLTGTEVEESGEKIMVQYVKACKSKKKCYGDPGVCSLGLILKKEGEKCLKDIDCETHKCNSQGKCEYHKVGESCASSNYCDKSSFCKATPDGGVCTNHIEENGDCDNDEDCAFGLLCSNISGGKCRYIFTLSDGEITTNRFLCASGSKHLIDNVWKCASKKVESTSCDVKGEQSINYNIGRIDYPVTKECKVNSQNQKIISLSSNSKLWTNYQNVFVEETKKMKKEKKKKINGANRYHYGNKKIIEAYAKYKYYYLFDGADKCVQDYLVMISSSKLYSLISKVTLYSILFVIFI